MMTSEEQFRSFFRKVKREDLPVCWFDSRYLVNVPTMVRGHHSKDVLTMLERRVYTRHLARLIMSYLTQVGKIRLYRYVSDVSEGHDGDDDGVEAVENVPHAGDQATLA